MHFRLTVVTFLFCLSSLAHAQSVLFVGDSITADSEISYSYQIKRACPNQTTEVLAEPGMETKWMLDHLKKQLEIRHYDQVFIWGGINDIYMGFSTNIVIKHIQTMVDLVLEKGGKPYVIIGYDAERFMALNKLQTSTDYPTKAALLKVKQKYIQYQTQLEFRIERARLIRKFDLSPKYTSDGIHPGLAGHKVIKNILMNEERLFCSN